MAAADDPRVPQAACLTLDETPPPVDMARFPKASNEPTAVDPYRPHSPPPSLAGEQMETSGFPDDGAKVTL